jgi:hypothetical protein
MPKFRKKPVEITAVQWTGDNADEMREFAGSNFDVLGPEDRANCDDPDATAQVLDKLHSTWVLLQTGDYVICGLKGELYPCRTDVFHASYDEVAS